MVAERFGVVGRAKLVSCCVRAATVIIAVGILVAACSSDDATATPGSDCSPEGGSEACFPGPPAARGVGQCRDGQRTCRSGIWSECVDAVLPADDTCDDELDNDCNGVADEGCPCTSGASRGCYDGPAQTRSIGECTDGHQDCVNDLWAAECVGSVLPEPESCNGLDSDCNGIADEDCSCVDGEIRPCYSGPPTTNGTGNCHSGSQTCTATAWPAGCPGEVLPTTESCDASDEDCDGVVDSSDCLVRVERFWNTDICSHQYKTGSITPDAGYVLEPGNHFYVYTTAVPGTVPLYQMSDGARHLVTLDPNEGTALGYNIASTLGYVVPDGSASWNAGGLGASPICRYTTTVCSDHVLWLASELPAPGYTQEVCLGFVWGWLG